MICGYNDWSTVGESAHLGRAASEVARRLTENHSTAKLLRGYRSASFSSHSEVWWGVGVMKASDDAPRGESCLLCSTASGASALPSP